MVKTRVAVVFGGASAEREVSRVSARAIVSNLPKEKFEVIPVAVDPGGCFRGREESFAALEGGLGILGPTARRLPPDLLSDADVVFPIVHGETGEDGMIQGFLDTLGLPYVGSDVAASALGMNKAAFKARVREAGLPTVRALAILRSRWAAAAPAVADEIARRFPLPVFVKPSNGGSSIGVSKVKDWEGLGPALALAFEYDRVALVEEAVDAREIECAVLGNEEARASGCGEIVPGREFYDYEDKYVEEGAKLLVPAPVGEETVREVRRLALAAFELCGCSGLARVDFFLDRKTGAVLLNELNTLPGFTSISMYPRLWAHAGVPLPELLETLVRLAVERYEARREESRRRPVPRKLS
jgi:D-alanine-D-alanine ligase